MCKSFFKPLIHHLPQIITLTFLLLVITGMKQFTLWDQVRGFYNLAQKNTNNELIDEIIAIEKLLRNYHLYEVVRFSLLPRYLVCAPIIFLHLWTGISVDIIFGLSAIALLSSTGILISKRKTCERSFYFLCLFLISIFMNGRLAFSFFGLAIFFNNIFTENSFNKFTSLTIAIICTSFISVSSGAHFILFLIGLVLLLQSSQLRRNPFLQLFLIISSPFISLGIIRNLIWHHFSIIRLLNHGAGKFINFNFALVLLILGAIFFFYIMKKKYFRAGNYKDILLANQTSQSKFNINFAILLLPFLGMFFGFSTFLSFIPIYLIYAFNLLLKTQLKFT